MLDCLSITFSNVSSFLFIACDISFVASTNSPKPQTDQETGMYIIIIATTAAIPYIGLFVTFDTNANAPPDTTMDTQNSASPNTVSLLPTFLNIFPPPLFLIFNALMQIA